MIKTVIRLRNGGVMVFDAQGEQVPVYQGQYEEIRQAILRETTPEAAFLHWFDCAGEPETVSRERW